MSNNINGKSTHLIRTEERDILSKVLSRKKKYLQNQVPLGFFWARSAKWGYMTKTLSYNGHSDKNISELDKKP